MPGEEETKVETTLNTSVVMEKKDIVEEEAKAVSSEEKKDLEKEENEANNKGAPKKEKKKKEASPPMPAVHKKDFETDVVYLYQFNRCPQVPSISPYCLKTETWMKLNNIKYENVDHKSKLRSKRGCLPFVELNGEEIADSDNIIKTLAKKFGKEMDVGLTQEQKNIQHAMIAMVDNHLLWLVSQWRTRHIDNTIKGYKLNLQNMTGSKIPNGILNMAFKYTYLRKVMRKVKATGLSDQPNDELDRLGQNDIKVLSDLLGDKQFFFGDEPQTLDINAFVQLALILCVDKEVTCPLRDFVESDCTNLVGLFNRMKDRCWGDHWAEATGESLDMNPHIPKPEPPVKEEEPPKKEESKSEEKEKEKVEEKEQDDSKDKDENKEKGDKDEQEKEENKGSSEEKN